MMRRMGSMAAAIGLLMLYPVGVQGAVPRVDVVFVLDTTGSMSGLIEGAKAKIWMIATEIVKGRPVPAVRMGLVGYRDRGDAYVTTHFDLSNNLDAVYEKLLGFRAEGGGDTPEHVLKALEEAVNQQSWDNSASTHKVIYLVGDAPAQMNYGDTASLEAIVASARRKGILINTVQCGGDPSTTAQWQHIANSAQGHYAQIAANGGMQIVATPYDAPLAKLSARLESTTLGFGSRREEARGRMALGSSVAAASPAPAAAERALYKSKAGYFGTYDLVEAVERKEVDLKKLKDSELPAEFQKLTPEARQKKLESLQADRKKLTAEINSLSVKRANYLTEQTKKMTRPEDGFDNEVIKSLHLQAAKKGIFYK